MFPPEISIAETGKLLRGERRFLAQTDNKVRGYLGDYPVEACRQRQKAYLLVSQGGWYYYSIVLEMRSRRIFVIGYYSAPCHADEQSGRISGWIGCSFREPGVDESAVSPGSRTAP